MKAQATDLEKIFAKHICDKGQVSKLWKHFFFKDCVYLYLDRKEGRERERERNINVWLHLMNPTGGKLAQNSGMCPDWESNRQPFGLQASAQSTEPHQPVLYFIVSITSGQSLNVTEGAK